MHTAASAVAPKIVNVATEPSAGGHPPSLQTQSWASSVIASGPAQGIRGPCEEDCPSHSFFGRQPLWPPQPCIHRIRTICTERQASAHPGQHMVPGAMPRRKAQATPAKQQQALWHRSPSTVHLSRQREAIHRPCRSRAGRQASTHPGQCKVSGISAKRIAQATQGSSAHGCAQVCPHTNDTVNDT